MKATSTLTPSSGATRPYTPQPHANQSGAGRLPGLQENVRLALRRLEDGRGTKAEETIHLFALGGDLSHAVRREADGGLVLIIGDVRGGARMQLHLIQPDGMSLLGAVITAAAEEIKAIWAERTAANPILPGDKA